MAGRPFLQMVEDRIERMGGEDEVVFERIAEGVPIREVVADLGCSRSFLYRWRDAKGHKERRRAKWEAAVKASAHALAEDSAVPLEELARNSEGLTNAEVSLAKARSEYRRWLASVRDRDTYGEAKQEAVQVNLSIGQLHLDALRQRGSMHRVRQLEAGEAREAELITEGEATD